MAVDLAIKNCKIVFPEGIISGAGVAVDEEKIVAVVKEPNLPTADKTIDAKGNYLIPGVIDPHSHLGSHFSFEDDFRTETQSAAGGGVTTLFTLMQDKRSLKEIVPKRIKMADRNATIDLSFGGGFMPSPSPHLDELADYIDLGVTAFKCKPATEKWGPIVVAGVDDGSLYACFKALGELGGLPMVHAENPKIVEMFRDHLMKTGRKDLPAYTESRPSFAEEEYMRRAIFIAKVASSPLYIVHISIGNGMDVVAEAKADGVNVIAETCPHYLTHTKDSGLGILGVVTPPLREKKDIEGLWHGIKSGVIDCMGSDHATIMPRSEKEKGDIWTTMPGWPGTETLLPVMLSEGVKKGRIPLEKVVEICCYNPARVFGLYPRKGTISVGSDGDLTIVDLDKKVKVTPDVLHSAADFTIYDGWEMKGWPVMTICRGNVVMEEGEIVGKPGTGRFIKSLPLPASARLMR